MWKVKLIIGMAILAVFATLLMRKIAPEDKIYPFWALFVVILFSLVVVFH